MIDLNKEAEEFADANYEGIITWYKQEVGINTVQYSLYLCQFAIQSKYVQAEKLKAQIEILYKLHKENRPDVKISIAALNLMQEVQQQLKQLNNENNTTTSS
jgi:hypothetical protein